MKRVELTAADAASPKDNNLVILTDKDSVQALDVFLTSGEAAFLKRRLDQGVQTFCFPRENHVCIVRFLTGEPDKYLAAEEARLAGNDVLREIRHYKLESVFITADSQAELLLSFVEGMVLGNYQFLKYYTDSEKRSTSLQRILLGNVAEEAVAELNILIDAVYQTRDLVNEPQSQLDAMQFAEIFAETGSRDGFTVEVLEKEQIESLRMGGLLAVNKGSALPPRFITAEWKPAHPVNSKPIVLIGKGVLYDTGGLSLKPTEGMEYMKCDMAGAATVLGVLSVSARTQLPIHIIGLAPLTDNRIGERAMAPGDVIRMYSGATVEVLNTDAEGRLLLADALHYARKFDPYLVLDLATLTGAAVRALGSQAICYMGNASESVKKTLEKSGWITYERLIELPLWKEYGEELKSNIADLKNIGSGNAGMITAGKFLEHFAADLSWLHLDIAGPAYLRSPNGYRTKDGTGVGVRLLYAFLRNLTF